MIARVSSFGRYLFDLHDNPAFQDFVAWLRRRLDEESEGLDDAAFTRMAECFRETVAKERAFHDAVMPR